MSHNLVSFTREAVKRSGATRCLHDPEWLVHKCFECLADHWRAVLEQYAESQKMQISEQYAKAKEETTQLEKVVSEQKATIQKLREMNETLQELVNNTISAKAKHANDAILAVKRRGLEPGELQMRWRTNPPDDYSTVEALDAICDALSRESIECWHGDATSCVEEIVRAQRDRAVRIVEQAGPTPNPLDLAARIRGGRKL